MNLFDLSHPDQPAFAPPLARSTDPATSHEAAIEISPKIARLTELAAEAVRETPGKTRGEINAIHCHGKDILGKRLDGARKLGLVRNGENRRCTVSGAPCQTWFPV